MRAEKQLLLDEIKDLIVNTHAFVLMRYAGMTANVANSFRVEIAKKGGFVEVMRKRVLIKAAEQAGVVLDEQQLEGHIGIVFARGDLIETAKAIFNFSRDNGEVVKVVGGRYEGQIYSASQVEMLSKLPSKDEMRAQFLGLLEAPMAQTLAVMDALLSSVVYCLDNKAGMPEGNS